MIRKLMPYIAITAIIVSLWWLFTNAAIAFESFISTFFTMVFGLFA